MITGVKTYSLAEVTSYRCELCDDKCFARTPCKLDDMSVCQDCYDNEVFKHG